MNWYHNTCISKSISIIWLGKGKIFKLKVKYLSKKTRFKWFQCIQIHSIPSPLKPKYITPKNETETCVCADLTSLADIYYKLM